MIVPAPMKPSPVMTWAPGQRSGGRSGDYENVCPETGRSVFHRPLDSNDAAADNREDHAEKNVDSIDIAKTIEKREHWKPPYNGSENRQWI